MIPRAGDGVPKVMNHADDRHRSPYGRPWSILVTAGMLVGSVVRGDKYAGSGNPIISNVGKYNEHVISRWGAQGRKKGAVFIPGCHLLGLGWRRSMVLGRIIPVSQTSFVQDGK